MSFYVKYGVRPGIVLSPSLFNVFVNILTVNLRHSDTGCHVSLRGYFVGCLYYADDIVILSPSLQGYNICLTPAIQYMSKFRTHIILIAKNRIASILQSYIKVT